MTRDEILALARRHDPDACWASDEPDDNCLLIAHSAAVFLLDRFPTAYDDPNEPGLGGDGWTRVVFPDMPMLP